MTLVAGAPVPTDGGAKGADFLQSLNERFHSTAQRIKEVRERIITFEDERVIATD